MTKLQYLIQKEMLLIFSEFLEKMAQEPVMNLKTEELNEKQLLQVQIQYGMRQSGMFGQTVLLMIVLPMLILLKLHQMTMTQGRGLEHQAKSQFQ